MTLPAGAQAVPLLHRVMARAARNLVPFQVTLELTYRCNLRCRHCYIDDHGSQELSLPEWKDVLEQLASAGTLYLLLTGGEPLVRRDFMELATWAKRRGFVLMLLTNGTLITGSVAQDIAGLKPLFVGLSLYGATAQTHEGVTGKPGSFAETMRAIELLRALGVKVKLQASLMDCNIHEAGAIRGLGENLGIPVRLSWKLLPGKSGELAPQQHEVGFDDLCKYVNPDWFEAPDAAATLSGVCKAGRGICSISPAGDVYPCVLMPLKMGNLRMASFSDIWKIRVVPELAYLRSLTPADLSQCQQCKIDKFCLKCMGLNLSETGQLTTSAPSACRNAAQRSEFLVHRREVTHERGLREADYDHGDN